MEAFHHEQVLVDGAMRLIDQGAGHRHQEVCEHGIPTCLFVLEPVSYEATIGSAMQLPSGRAARMAVGAKGATPHLPSIRTRALAGFRCGL